ncbi:MAG: hypothetical protein WBA16_00265 [Nonlabens sp.]
MNQSIKENAALKKSRSRFKGLGKQPLIYKGNRVKHHHTPEEVAAFKKAYQREVRISKKRSIIVWIITLILTPSIIYLLVTLWMLAFS